jgi:hypothetical protein
MQHVIVAMFNAKRYLIMLFVLTALYGCTNTQEQSSTQYRIIYNETYCQEAPARFHPVAVCAISPWEPIKSKEKQ